ncbi:MAG: phage tail length tape measure family protein, partial [Dechloromonas sp.]|nr:phage tail length tape measure family protein [Dechloromonas sp.]
AAPAGFSISEAREFAATLAQTGKIANDNLLPIVQMGKDISHVFGVDATESAKLLADAFSDPAKGADSLNQRLGFLDAGMRRNIDNLVAQNKTFEAQRVLMEGVKSGLDGVSDAVSGSTKLWTALANGISNTWDRFGEFIAKGLGGVESLEEKIARTRKELDALKAGGNATPILPGGEVDLSGRGDDASKIAEKTAELEKYTNALQKNAMASAVAQAAQKSFLVGATARSLSPEIAERGKLANDVVVLTKALDDLGNNEAAADLLKRLGLSMEQLAQATQLAADKQSRFKTEFQSTLDQLRTANQAITAFSPGQKGLIAYQESLNSTVKSGLSNSERQVIAEQAKTNAIKQATTAISEQYREQVLASKQAVENARLEVSLVGQSLGKQVELKANLQAQQQLYAAAAQNRTLVNGQLNASDKATLELIKQQNAELGKQRQLEAEKAAYNQASFDLQTAGLSGVELQIAQLNYQLHGNSWKQYGDSATAQLMRIADAQKTLNDAMKDFGRDLLSSLQQGKSLFSSLESAAGGLVNKLANAGLDKLFNGLKNGTINFDLSGLGKDISKSVGKGLTEGLDDIELRGRNAGSNPNNSFAFNGNGLATGAAAAAAGIGIYGQAKQAGAAGASVGSGALSGALTVALAGTAILPGIGTAIGAVGGAIAGLFGASEGARQAANQAKDAWNSAKSSAMDFAAVLAGGGNGSLSQAFSQAGSQAQQFVDTALKAKDYDSVIRFGRPTTPSSTALPKSSGRALAASSTP